MIVGNLFLSVASHVVSDGVRDDEVAIGQTLHQSTRPQPVGTVIREVCLAENKQSRHVALQVVVDPQSTHRVVHGGVNPHRYLVRVFVGDLVVHVEEVAVLRADRRLAIAGDRVFEIEKHGLLSCADSKARVATFLGRAGRNVSRNHVSEGGVAAFEVVVPLAFRDVRGASCVALCFRDPDATVVAEAFAHQSQLRLVVTADRNTRRVNLRVTRVGEEGSAFVAPPGGRHVAAFGIGRQVKPSPPVQSTTACAV